VATFSHADPRKVCSLGHASPRAASHGRTWASLRKDELCDGHGLSGEGTGSDGDGHSNAGDHLNGLGHLQGAGRDRDERGAEQAGP